MIIDLLWAQRGRSFRVLKIRILTRKSASGPVLQLGSGRAIILLGSLDAPFFDMRFTAQPLRRLAGGTEPMCLFGVKHEVSHFWHHQINEVDSLITASEKLTVQVEPGTGKPDHNLGLDSHISTNWYILTRGG